MRNFDDLSQGQAGKRGGESARRSPARGPSRRQEPAPGPTALPIRAIWWRPTMTASV